MAQTAGSRSSDVSNTTRSTCASSARRVSSRSPVARPAPGFQINAARGFGGLVCIAWLTYARRAHCRVACGVVIVEPFALLRRVSYAKDQPSQKPTSVKRTPAANRFVALLRGVNVGGNNMIKMSVLRESSRRWFQ